jgi:drug/metabolite transporter (DMT)-like permease
MEGKLLDSAAAIRSPIPPGRLKMLQALGVFCGFAAGAWLGGAEAPVKLAQGTISPVTISLIMVAGVFLARWSIPALIRGTSYIRKDVAKARHLIVWAVLAGCMWAVANTLTIYAIRDVGLSIAFPLWNTNSLLAIFWGFLLFNELRQAGWRRWLGVIGGALTMFGGAALLAVASSAQAHGDGRATQGIAAALSAGVLWGTMYIPYRKAYLTGMNPLSFLTFFTFGELGTMAILAASYRGTGVLWHELVSARDIMFWLMLGGFIWVMGDLFQQYAAKYVGISRGVPLSNTNQLWGLLWGILVFHELHSESRKLYSEVIGGSVLMALGALAIALSSATKQEHVQWQDAAEREGKLYGVDESYVRASMEGQEFEVVENGRSLLDWALVGGVIAIFSTLAVFARIPQVDVSWGWAAAISLAMLVLLGGCVIALWRTTRFN